MNRYSISMSLRPSGRNTRPEGSFKKRADALSPTADHVVAQALPLEIDVHSNNLTAARRSVTECAPIVPQVFARAGKKKGRPCGRPFHCRAVIRLNLREHTAFRRCGSP